MPPIITLLVRGANEWTRLITPYRADVFSRELAKFGLPDNLLHGLRIGTLLRLPRSITPPNKSAIEHIDFISSSIVEQVSLRRMSGPFSREQLESQSLFGTCFMSTSLSVVVTAGSPDKLRLIQTVRSQPLMQI